MSKSLSTTVQQQLAARQQNMAERLAGLGSDGASMPFIKAKNRQFKIDDEVVGDELYGVILDWAFHNSYWPGAYNPNESSPPVCAAVGQIAESMAPPENATDRQHDNCATCPQNQWGSGGGNRKACKNTVNLALLRWDDEEEDEQIYFLSVPPTSLKAFREYNGKLAKAGLDTAQVVTRISFNSKFEYVNFLFDADKRRTEDYTDEDDDGNSYIAGFLTKLPEATELVTKQPYFETEDE